MLIARDGSVLGRLPEFPVETPWWQEAQPVVAGVRDRFGLDIVVLRLLDTELPRPQGGGVTYLAEPRGHLPSDIATRLLPFDGHLDEQPLRVRWASPGGPAQDLAWAEAVLRRRRLERVGHAAQLRSWNLSSIWRLPLRDGAAWLKVVPPFFAHEGDVLRLLQGGPVPRLLGHDRDRILLADVAGSDRHDADPDELFEMVSLLVDLQAAWVGRTGRLQSIGLPDWSGPALAAEITDVVERRSAMLPPGARAVLDDFVAGLQERFEAIGACGLPDTIVHGDFHPGNVRGGDDLRRDVEGGGAGNHALTLLDWGDCGFGNPLLDQPAFLDRISPDLRATVSDHWWNAWRRHRPGSDPARAAFLIGPVAAARQALIYQRFLDHIEPVERRFHDADVPEWLVRTASLAAATPA